MTGEQVAIFRRNAMIAARSLRGMGERSTDDPYMWNFLYAAGSTIFTLAVFIATFRGVVGESRSERWAIQAAKSPKTRKALQWLGIIFFETATVILFQALGRWQWSLFQDPFLKTWAVAVNVGAMMMVLIGTTAMAASWSQLSKLLNKPSPAPVTNSIDLRLYDPGRRGDPDREFEVSNASVEMFQALVRNYEHKEFEMIGAPEFREGQYRVSMRRTQQYKDYVKEFRRNYLQNNKPAHEDVE